MYQKLLAGSDLLLLPQIGLAIFFLTFVAVLAHVVITRRKGESFDRVAELPLEDHETATPAGARGER